MLLTNSVLEFSVIFDIVILSALLIALAMLGYLIRSARALHRKANRNADRNSKEMLTQLSKIRTELGNTYHQIEAIEQLLPMLKLSAPLPPSRGWAGSPDFLLTLAQITKTTRPKLSVELGSGISTLVLSKSGAKKVVSLDHSQEFGQQTRAMLATHGVRGVDIRIHDLETYPSGYQWYAQRSLKGLSKIDLLVIDGPPSSTNPDARYAALEHLVPLLSPKATVILDDASRDEERKLALAILAALPGHCLEMLAHEKGTAVISPTLKR
jgi:predicted O-methyltransferase YrrM